MPHNVQGDGGAQGTQLARRPIESEERELTVTEIVNATEAEANDKYVKARYEEAAMARGSADDVSAVDSKPSKQSLVKQPAQAQGGEGQTDPACVPTKEVLIVGRYAIVTFLGRGATGVVHEVRDLGGDSVTFACKTVDSALGPGGFKLPIPSDLNSQAPEDLLVLEVLNKGVEASRHELSTWEKFDHPNVVKLHHSIMEGPYKIRES
ncbi:hypothetical protein FRB93_006600 [Tulasnella sp. JGI-2019a]|nr:hypothetical protein FRB93_006600 [Tulasnella sp. JGI-2019a]